jgi:hypothetical protein
MRNLGRVLAAASGNRRPLRVVAAYWIFITTEYSVWIAILVYAYERGGVRAAGLIGVAQLAPAALAAPLVATIADRNPPVRVMVASYVIQGGSYAAAAALIWADGPTELAYASAIAASTALVAIRPAQAPLAPALATSASELTAANVVSSWADNVGIVGAGLLTGALLAADGVASVLAGAAALLVAALVLVAPLRTKGLAIEDEGSSLQQAASALQRPRQLAATPRLLVALVAAEYLVLGALDVLRPRDLDSRRRPAVGGLSQRRVRGRRGARRRHRRQPRRPQARAADHRRRRLLLGRTRHRAVRAPPGAHACPDGRIGGIAIAVRHGDSHPAAARAVPCDVLGRVFGVAEGLSMAALGVGTIAVPALIAIGGNDAALIGAAAVLQITGLLGLRPLLRLDDEALVPVVEIALLRVAADFRKPVRPGDRGRRPRDGANRGELAHAGFAHTIKVTSRPDRALRARPVSRSVPGRSTCATPTPPSASPRRSPTPTPERPRSPSALSAHVSTQACTWISPRGPQRRGSGLANCDSTAATFIPGRCGSGYRCKIEATTSSIGPVSSMTTDGDRVSTCWPETTRHHGSASPFRAQVPPLSA